jgi:hypothetical protein
MAQTPDTRATPSGEGEPASGVPVTPPIHPSVVQARTVDPNNTPAANRPVARILDASKREFLSIMINLLPPLTQAFTRNFQCNTFVPIQSCLGFQHVSAAISITYTSLRLLSHVPTSHQPRQNSYIIAQISNNFHKSW